MPDPSDAESFEVVARSLCRRAVETARDIVLTGELPIESDPNQLPGPVQQRLLRALLEDVPQPPANYGSRAIPADHATHRAVRDLLEQDPTLGAGFLVGEEAERQDWVHGLSAPVGAAIYALDAIDGSGPFDDITFGFGTTIIGLRRTPVGYDLRGAAVCNSSGICVVGAVEADRCSVSVGSLADPERDAGLPLLATDLGGYNRSVAIVAAKPDDRGEAAWLLDSEAVNRSVVYNTGGSPAAVGLLRGKVGALVAIREQSTWDAAFLPMVAALDLPILDLETGERYSWEDVVRWMTQLQHPDAQVKPVPPYIAARTDSYAQEVLSAYRAR